MRWLAVGGLLGNEIFNVGSISVAIWLVGSEVFPLGVRGKGMSLVALSHWTFDLLISLTTLSLVSADVNNGGVQRFLGDIHAWRGLFYQGHRWGTPETPRPPQPATR